MRSVAEVEKVAEVELQGQLLQHAQGMRQMPAESTVAHLSCLNHNHMVPADHGVAQFPPPPPMHTHRDRACSTGNHQLFKKRALCV